MTPTELPEWVRTTKETGATRISVKRAPKGHKGDVVEAFAVDLPTDVSRMLSRMRDDVRTRKLGLAIFIVESFDGEGKLLATDRVSVGRDEVLPDTPEADVDPGVAMARAAMSETRQAFAMMIDMAAGQREVVTQLSNALVSRDARIETMLSSMFDMFTLQQERAAEIGRSADTRALGKEAITVLGPIAGAMVSHYQNKPGAAMMGLLAKILNDPKRVDELFAWLTPEERIAFGTVLEQLKADKAKNEVDDTSKEKKS